MEFICLQSEMTEDEATKNRLVVSRFIFMLIRELLFIDDATIAAHSQIELQMSSLSSNGNR